MGEAYEFDGELFTNVGEYLDAVAHEYKSGDKDAALQSLEDYGFSLSDINSHSAQPHPLSADDNADPEEDDATVEEE